MGIIVEYNPDLALRNISEHKAGRRKVEECIPEGLEVGKTYPFLKDGQRNYWLHGEVPLIETEGNGKLSRPLGSVVILEATHFLDDGHVKTRGTYGLVELFNDSRPHFDGFARV